MISFKKNLLTIEKMEEIIGDYNRVYDDVMEKHSKQLIAYYNSLGKYSSKETTDIIGEKIAMLTKIRFEHNLRDIYDPYETDQILVERQEELMYDMLYATETYMDLRRANKINIKNY